jgi:hypothetical protein
MNNLGFGKMFGQSGARCADFGQPTVQSGSSKVRYTALSA